jgi:hypothetical protein
MAKHSVNPEQGGMGMNRRCIDSLGIIQHNGRIDEKSENTRAHQIPECNGNKEIHRPFICVGLSAFPHHFEIVNNLKSQQGKGHNLQRGKNSPQCNNGNGTAGPVQMMKGSDHTAAQIEKNGKVHGH